MKLDAKIEGGAALGAAFARLAQAEGLVKVIEASADDVREAAIANLGGEQRGAALAASLEVVRGGDGLTFLVSTPLEDGWHREYGRLNDAAQPWLAPALDAARPSVDVRLGEWLSRTIKQTQKV
jgi:hypothetical protein